MPSRPRIQSLGLHLILKKLTHSNSSVQGQLFETLNQRYIGHSSSMRPIEKLGQQLKIALAHEIPVELTALVVTTSNPKRLQELFKHATISLLDAHQNVILRPNSVAAKAERERKKALLDLIRARISTNGTRKPSIQKMMAMLATRPPAKLVEIRRAA